MSRRTAADAGRRGAAGRHRRHRSGQQAAAAETPAGQSPDRRETQAHVHRPRCQPARRDRPRPTRQVEPEPIDEAAEEQAAAAEAAAIGGSAGNEYAGSELGEPATEAERPLAEAGEGVAEGQEQAEAELEENAGPGDEGVSDAERQIDDTIEAADNPAVGETPEAGTHADGADAGRPTTTTSPAATGRRGREAPSSRNERPAAQKVAEE